MPSIATASVVVNQPTELIERYYPNGRLGGLMVDGEAPSQLGAEVEVTVRVKKPVREFAFRGVVAWARHRAARQPASFGVDFTLADGASRDRLLAFARNEVSAEGTRGEPRLHLELSVRVVHRGQVSKERLADLSHGGAFVRTRSPLARGEVVELSIRPPLSFGSISVRGAVVWTRRTGPQPGMGIEFITDQSTRGRIHQLLARLTKP